MSSPCNVTQSSSNVDSELFGESGILDRKSPVPFRPTTMPVNRQSFSRTAFQHRRMSANTGWRHAWCGEREQTAKKHEPSGPLMAYLK